MSEKNYQNHDIFTIRCPYQTPAYEITYFGFTKTDYSQVSSDDVQTLCSIAPSTC